MNSYDKECLSDRTHALLFKNNMVAEYVSIMTDAQLKHEQYNCTVQVNHNHPKIYPSNPPHLPEGTYSFSQEKSDKSVNVLKNLGILHELY